MPGDVVGPSTGVLARFTRDLTAEARRGTLEPVRCRADEIARVIDILLRHGKNNPVLVGAAGVGKTAVAEGLAQRVAAGDAPLVLREVRILALDHVALLAGTTYRGQYEERIRGLVSEATAAPDAILFIDELHNLMGQGTALGVAMDAANMLKPALVRGDFRVIGATTSEEYHRWIRSDAALERRFQKVEIRELGSDETLEILRARQLRLERHHNVVIAEGALEAAVMLTDRFIVDRARPDRAIDALDEACAHAQAGASYDGHTEELVRERREILRALTNGGGPGAACERRVWDGARTARGDRGRARNDESGEARTRQAAKDDAAGADPFVRMARNGMAALERFGAELDAVFASENGNDERLDGPTPAGGSTAARARRREGETTPDVRRLAALDVEIARRLMEAGVVVRAHDVARVVSVATGRSVTWVE